MQKDLFKGFITSLSKVVTMIKTETKKIYLPVSISNSPLNPETEMLVLMRNGADIKIPGFDIKNFINEAVVDSLYSISTLQFMSRDPG